MSRLRPRRFPRRLGAGLAVVVAIAAVVVIVLAVGSPSSTNGATNSGGSPGATTVQRRDLVQTDTQAGTLSYAKPHTVYDRLSGTITWLPAVGQVIRPGQALYRVSGQPVVLMNGTTPAYRDLSAADSAGADILQLNRGLVALGFNPSGIVVDDVWQSATTAAVEVFQQSLGETPTGILTLGQVVFLPGAQVVSTLDAALGSSGGSGGSGSSSSSTPASTVPRSPSAQFVSLDTGRTTGPTGATGPNSRSTSKTPNTLAALLALLKAQSAQLKAETAELKAARQASGSSPSSSQKANSAGNSPSGKSANGSNTSNSANNAAAAAGTGTGGGGNATAILQTSSTQLVATVNLDASKQSEAKVGEKLTVQLPAGSTVNGTIAAVSSVAQTSNSSATGSGSGGNNSSANNNSSSSSTATIPVTISLAGHLSGAGLDQAAVSVNFAQAKATSVLSVPVTALLASSGGGYAVQGAVAPHHLIPVSTGLFAAGYVEISGSGIYPGLQVTDSQG